MIFTFWEGKKPAYIEMCQETWNFLYVELNYDNLHQWTDLPVDKLQRFTLPQIADCVRVHVLRDNGGQWLDADTIVLDNRLPNVTILGDPTRRTNSIGYLNSYYHPDMFRDWAEYQDMILEGYGDRETWSIMGNSFTDPYLLDRRDIEIGDINGHCPERYMILEDSPRWMKYQRLYFDMSLQLHEFEPTSMIMLHNSWTPEWYKDLYREEVLDFDVTLSNILATVIR